MNRIQEALMHLHKIVMFVPDEVQDELSIESKEVRADESDIR